MSKLIVTTAILLGMGVPVLAEVSCPNAVRQAINKYKSQDYIGCIQDLTEYSQDDPTNAISYYYTGVSYMKIGMKEKAIESFAKVAALNSIPILSSYAVQASQCMMTDQSPCVYKKYSASEIEEMVFDPTAFFTKEAETVELSNTREIVPLENLTDIDKLIQGEYPENIHPDANKVLQETRLLQEQEKVNSELRQRTRKKAPENQTSDASNIGIEKLASVSDKEIADAVRTLDKAGYKFISPEEQSNNSQKNPNPYKQMADFYAFNQDASEMAMLFGTNNNSRNNSFNQMLPYLLMQEQQIKSSDANAQQRKMSPELIKTMMMSSMMNDFDFNFDRNNDR